MTAVQSNSSLDPIYFTQPFIDPTNPTHASTSMHGGQAVFENDNYRITAGDNNEVNITNKHTGETYQIWGDPHVNVDGKHAFDFWGKTTFQLEDGTKVTIDTTPYAANPNATLASKVTITNGDYGVQISGVDTNTKGDLKIDEAKGWGRVLDDVVDDGNVLQENPAGKGFLAVDGNGKIHAVDQQYINGTDLVKNGADKLQDQFKNMFQAFSGLLSISFAGMFVGALAHAIEHAVEHAVKHAVNDLLHPKPSEDRAYLLGGANALPKSLFDGSSSPKLSMRDLVRYATGPLVTPESQGLGRVFAQGGPSTNPKTPFEGFFDKAGLLMTMARAQA